VYRDYNYDLGNQLLLLRTRIALTQIALAEQIGVHRRSVQNWETGLSYPKAEMLQRLIAVFLQHHAFTPGNERAEAHALWQQATQDGPHPLPAFDEVWFARTLALQSASPAASAQGVDREREESSRATPTGAPRPETSHAIIDWGEAIAVPTLYGRAGELQTLQHWVVQDRCRVVAIVGIGGMGKSSLAITFAQRVLPEFDVVLFRSLQNGPPLAEGLDQTIRAVSDQRATPPDQVSDKIALLIQLFRARRCLLILDNAATRWRSSWWQNRSASCSAAISAPFWPPAMRSWAALASCSRSNLAARHHWSRRFCIGSRSSVSRCR